MKDRVPAMLLDAMRRGTWRDPGHEVLQELFANVAELPEMELFTDLSTMASVRDQIRAGFVDDPQFCMVRDETGLEAPTDPRLVFDEALFVAGSMIPGEDVLVALDLRHDDPVLLAFDWTRDAPARWVRVGRLSTFIAGLERCGD